MAVERGLLLRRQASNSFIAWAWTVAMRQSKPP
jgi:hypothetical protein